MTKKINLNFENPVNFKYDENVINKIVKTLLTEKSVYGKSCLKNLSYHEVTIDFVFCDDEFIHKINKEYRGFDKPTDVISFALFCDDENKIETDIINLGEILVSVDTAKRQAEENNHSSEKEVYYLITHGVMHLLGFDHQSEQEYNFMVGVQNQVMKELNYV